MTDVDLTAPGLRACVLRFTREDGSPDQLCGYLEPEPDGTLSFITREAFEFRQVTSDLHESLAKSAQEAAAYFAPTVARALGLAHELADGRKLHNVHSPDACTGQACCIHNPSNHHMCDWPMVWRDDRGLMERTCPHGTGHPDPDHMAYVLTMPGPVDERESGVHGCDGCCQPQARSCHAP